MNNDVLKRIVCDSLNIRAYTVTTINLVNEILGLHKTTPNATIPLGRTINATALLSASLKPDSNQNLSYQIQGNGPLKEIHVQADAQGNMRAYVGNPDIDNNSDFDSIDFSRAIGAGMLTITKDIGMKEPYSGTSPILYADIAMDTAYYLSQSEQIPSALILGLNVDSSGKVLSSGGILIQSFPDTPDESISLVENNIKNMKDSLGTMLAEGKNILAVLSEIVGDAELTILSETDLSHKCKCSREMLFSIISNFDQEDLVKMIEEDHGAEVSCTFCSRKYSFSEDDLKETLN